MGGHLTIFVSLLAACGSPGLGPPASNAVGKPALDLPPLPRSSIAAVLLHREDLALTDEQVHGLQQIDEQLADRVAALNDRTPRDGGVARRPASPYGSAGSAGPGRGMGTRRGMGRPRLSGGQQQNPNRPETSQDRLDDLDTQAYLQAEEEILTDEQKEKARDIAEEYREALYDRRARLHGEKPPE
jgi:hypothetical protein